MKLIRRFREAGDRPPEFAPVLDHPADAIMTYREFTTVCLSSM